MMTIMKLKTSESCYIELEIFASCPYRLNSLLSPACIRATMVFVTDVPMFEPIIIGTADFTSNTTTHTIHTQRQTNKSIQELSAFTQLKKMNIIECSMIDRVIIVSEIVEIMTEQKQGNARTSAF